MTLIYDKNSRKV